MDFNQGICFDIIKMFRHKKKTFVFLIIELIALHFLHYQEIHHFELLIKICDFLSELIKKMLEEK